MTGTPRAVSRYGPGRRWVPAVVLVAALAGNGPALAQGSDCTGFTEEEITSGGTNGAAAIHAADLDGANGNDIIAASHNDSKIFWYQNDGSPTPAFTSRLVTDRARGVVSIFAADLDGDGDQDVLSASELDDKIAWHENIGTNPPAFFERIVTLSANHAQSVYAADVDGDGDTDILSASFVDDKIAWYENPLIDLDSDGGTVFVQRVVSVEANGAASVFAADIDGDLDTDILSASTVDDKIAWYENLSTDADSDGSTDFVEHIVTTDADGAKSVHAADLDSDGDVDVLSASVSDDTIAWYENQGGDPVVFVERVLSTTADGAKSVLSTDVDDDNDLDVLFASENNDTVAWFENLAIDADSDGGIDFVEHIVSSAVDSADAVHAADIDGDGDTDVLSASSPPGSFSKVDRVAWYQSDDAQIPGWTERVIAETAEGANALSAADIDSDGDLDLVTASDADRISWYEIEGATEPTFTRHIISETVSGASSVFAIDLDGDDDQDIVAAAAESDTVSWFDSNGADPPVFTERVISTNADSVESVYVADVDTDGDLDVLSASSEDDKISWYESDGGSPPGFVERVIASADPDQSDFRADGAQSVFAIDVDSDGHTDILSASAEDGKIAWFRNLAVDADSDGEIDFEERVIIENDDENSNFPAAGARWVSAADVDSDGDMDVLSASALNNRVAWYEQDVDTDGGGEIIFTQRVISSVTYIPVFVSTADLDGDGDLDVLTGSVGDDQVAWFENDGSSPPVFTGHAVDSQGADPAAILTTDLTGDMRPDLLVGFRFGLAWYEQIGEICGGIPGTEYGGFDADGDTRIDGIELAWLTRAFGLANLDPGAPPEWWDPIDFNRDGIVDGDDLAILSSVGVWGTTTDSCTFSCR